LNWRRGIGRAGGALRKRDGEGDGRRKRSTERMSTEKERKRDGRGALRGGALRRHFAIFDVD
jgi:hypothetical protein